MASVRQNFAQLGLSLDLYTSARKYKLCVCPRMCVHFSTHRHTDRHTHTDRQTHKHTHSLSTYTQIPRRCTHLWRERVVQGIELVKCVHNDPLAPNTVSNKRRYLEQHEEGKKGKEEEQEEEINTSKRNTLGQTQPGTRRNAIAALPNPSRPQQLMLTSCQLSLGGTVPVGPMTGAAFAASSLFWTLSPCASTVPFSFLSSPPPCATSVLL